MLATFATPSLVSTRWKASAMQSGTEPGSASAPPPGSTASRSLCAGGGNSHAAESRATGDEGRTSLRGSRSTRSWPEPVGPSVSRIHRGRATLAARTYENCLCTQTQTLHAFLARHCPPPGGNNCLRPRLRGSWVVTRGRPRTLGPPRLSGGATENRVSERGGGEEENHDRHPGQTS
jgi:hypothetical protein